MNELEDRLRAVVAAAPDPDRALLNAIAARAGGRAAPRPRRRLLGYGAAALTLLALAGAVLLVGLRRPAPHAPRSGVGGPPPQPLADAVRVVGIPSTFPRGHGFPSGLAPQVVASSVRAIAPEVGEPVGALADTARVFLLRNGAACLQYVEIDCALPDEGRHLLEAGGRGGALSGTHRVVVAAPDVARVVLVAGDERWDVPLRGGVGRVDDDRIGNFHYLVTLADGRTVREPRVTQRSVGGPPTGVGLEAPRAMLPRAGVGIVEPPAALGGLGSGFVPGSVRELGVGLGAERDAAYAWVGNGPEPGALCQGLVHRDGSVVYEVCGGSAVGVYLAGIAPQYAFPDYVVGMVAASVRRAWVELPGGSRLEAKITRSVLRVDVPLDRTARAYRVFVELSDGRVVEA